MKPLRRSITFWSGLFVLISLLWLLVDSFRMYSSVWTQDGASGRFFAAGIGEGGFGFGTGVDRGPKSFTRFYRKPADPSGGHPPLLSLLIPVFKPDRPSLSIPFPLLVLLHLGLWRFLMHRRRLRMQRAELTGLGLPSGGENSAAPSSR